MADICQVRVLYKFDAQPGSGELSVEPGEILNVTRQDVGEGWWEGQNSRGQIGLFPETYVEVVQDNGPPAMPPPPLPTSYKDNNSHQNLAPQQSSQSYDDDWDDDWDDDESGYYPPTQQQAYHHGDFKDHRHGGQGSETHQKYGTVKRSFNRFSSFVKSGGEAYLLGQQKINVSDADKIAILESEDGPIWVPQQHPYTCSITSPKKEAKFHGFKSFIAYQITPSFNMTPVSRRYKHFDWLIDRLEEKFAMIPVPPIPDKQVTGRYEEEFIERRMAGLQQWINRICRHPVIANSEVWNHFLTCTSDEKRWKLGKRRAEKDEFVGGSFFLTINTPEITLNVRNVEDTMDKFGKFVKSMDDSVRDGIQTMGDNCKRHRGPYKREFQRIGHAFTALGQSFELDTRQSSLALTAAIKHTGATYNEIGQLFGDQPREDAEPLIDDLHEYKGLLGNCPDILEVHKGALKKVKECQKMVGEGKLKNDDATAVARRGDVISYALLAEINHFQSERVIDFKLSMQKYLQQQIAFYNKIVVKLEESLKQYEHA